VPAAGAFTDALAKAAEALVTAAGEVVPATLDERLDKIEAILADRRSKTFPIGVERETMQQASQAMSQLVRAAGVLKSLPAGLRFRGSLPGSA
jgi:hypothetical protein